MVGRKQEQLTIINMNVIGLIGLGGIGYPLAKTLRKNHIKILAFDMTDANRLKAANNGIVTTSSISGVVMHLPKRKIICLVLESIEEVKEAIARLSELLNNNDIIIDASNVKSKERLSHYHLLKNNGIHLILGNISNNRVVINSTDALIPVNKSILEECSYFAEITT